MMQDILIDNFDAINEAFNKLSGSQQQGLITHFNDSFEDDAAEKIGNTLFGNCRDDFVEKMQKLGTEEKEELKKAVEEAGLLAKEENNSQENI